MPALLGYTREIGIRLKDARAAWQHDQRHGWVILKHLNSYIALAHGSPQGEIMNLRDIQTAAKAAHINITGYCCCYPLACRKANPGLNVLGGWDAETGVDWHEWGLTIYVA